MNSACVLAIVTFAILMQFVTAQNGNPIGRDHSFRAVSLSKDTTSIIEKGYKKTIIVFANNYTCISCNAVINDYLFGHNVRLEGVDVVVIFRPGESSMSNVDLWIN